MSKQRVRRLLQACVRMRREMTGLLNTGELAQGEYLVLLALRQRNLTSTSQTVDPSIKASGLSDAVGISRPNVTRLLNSLQSKGLITRTMSEVDRRVMLVDLTPAGVEAVQKANCSLLRIADQLVLGLGEDDTERLIELLDKLSVVYQQIRIETEAVK